MKKVDTDFSGKLKRNFRKIGDFKENLNVKLCDRRMDFTHLLSPTAPSPPSTLATPPHALEREEPLLSTGRMALPVMADALGKWKESVKPAQSPMFNPSGSWVSPDFSWDSENSDTEVNANGSASIFVLGGISPFTWKTETDGFSLADETTSSRENTLNADADACGTASIIVTDHYNQNTNGSVSIIAFTWDEENPDEMDPSDSVEITVNGGTPPYSWSVEGTDFSIPAGPTNENTNTLTSGPDACGTAGVSVTDSCELELNGSVRCTVGRWNEVIDCGSGTSGEGCVVSGGFMHCTYFGHGGADACGGPTEVCGDWWIKWRNRYFMENIYCCRTVNYVGSYDEDEESPTYGECILLASTQRYRKYEWIC